jgi:hypothetical protein
MTMATKTSKALRSGLLLALALGTGIQLSTQYYYAMLASGQAVTSVASGCDAAPPPPVRRPRHRAVEGCFEAPAVAVGDTP